MGGRSSVPRRRRVQHDRHRYGNVTISGSDGRADIDSNARADPRAEPRADHHSDGVTNICADSNADGVTNICADSYANGVTDTLANSFAEPRADHRSDGVTDICADSFADSGPFASPNCVADPRAFSGPDVSAWISRGSRVSCRRCARVGDCRPQVCRFHRR